MFLNNENSVKNEILEERGLEPCLTNLKRLTESNLEWNASFSFLKLFF
jgi:hypothetical protein